MGHVAGLRVFTWCLAFLLAYGAMYAAGGKLIDVLGTRKGFFLIMVWWSLACASHGLAAGFGMLAASRLLPPSVLFPHELFFDDGEHRVAARIRR